MSLRDYYDRRAEQYEEIYRREDPVRRGELEAIAAAMCRALAGRRVLEIACGTGYWTERLAVSAERVVGIDAAPRMLRIARAKGLPGGKVCFRQADALELASIPGEFDAALANFWLSHVPRADLGGFLDALHRRIGAGGRVFLADNVYLPGVGGELVADPSTADTFKLRALADGSTHRVLKNYFTADQLREVLAGAEDLSVHVGRCFWWLDYTISQPHWPGPAAVV